MHRKVLCTVLFGIPRAERVRAQLNESVRAICASVDDEVSALNARALSNSASDPIAEIKAGEAYSGLPVKIEAHVGKRMLVQHLRREENAMKKASDNRCS